PFGGHTMNPAEAVAKALDGRAVGGLVVRSAVLPVDHATAGPQAARLAEDLDPRAIVHLGLAGGPPRVALERVAVNVMDSDTPDNPGYRARNESCVPGGPPAYFATLPLAAMLEALLADGLPAYVSNTAGTYLCNQTLYGTLHRLARQGHPAPAGFLHLPPLPPMVAATPLPPPRLDPP